VNRGEIWLAEAGRKRRPVLVLTRNDVLDVRALVTVAEISARERGLAVEIPLDPDVALSEPSVVNCDGLHTVPQAALTTLVGSVSTATMRRVCTAVNVALGCG
jgi:mRNA-degrading endonuclease toxin of MazEF toxin-antitoxin module